VHCGDDDVAVPAIAVGARGLISVAGNVLPREIARMVRAALLGDFAEASEMQRDLLPFIDTLFAEANPIPVKALLSLMGRCSDRVRLPLVPATPELRNRLQAFLGQRDFRNV
jgi:4-hydroxy-tetrahydrodipicolinate synthase